MIGQRGQATIEAVVALPLCIAVSFGLIAEARIIQGQIALERAAGSAAVAQVEGRDAGSAARAAGGGTLRSMQVAVTDRRVRVSAEPIVGLPRILVPRLNASMVIDGGQS